MYTLYTRVTGKPFSSEIGQKPGKNSDVERVELFRLEDDRYLFDLYDIFDDSPNKRVSFLIINVIIVFGWFKNIDHINEHRLSEFIDWRLDFCNIDECIWQKVLREK